jgi:signal transduction histidine kinase
MPWCDWIEAPQRRLLILFMAVMLTIVGTLGWLGWRLLGEDRERSRQSIQERLNGAAEAASAVLARKLSETETALTTEPPSETADDFLTVTFTPDGIEAHPRASLLYYPFVPSVRTEPARVFDAGEQVELQQERYAEAAAIFRELANSGDPAIRAGALLRAARSLRKAGNINESLVAYAELARMGPIPVDGGLPADLEARYKRIELFHQSQQSSTCEQEASILYRDLQRGVWRLSLDQWNYYSEVARSCFKPDTAAEIQGNNAGALAAGAAWLWQEWQKIRKGDGHSTGRMALWIDDRPVVVVWHGSPDRLVGAIAGNGFIKTDWGSALQQIGEDYRFQLSDAEGHVVCGSAAAGASQHATKSLTDAQVPWTLHAELANSDAEFARLDVRRRWLLAGFGLVGVLILTGGYFVARSFARELEVARLQSDFVAAVSHEFRTPLASLRQASELLADGRVSSEERRQAYYDALRSETERLQRLVEDLLDFRRMDAGVQQYRFEPLSVDDLVRNVTEEFSGTMPDKDCSIEIKNPDSLPRVQADRHALGRALRNLLDNAVKYSPHSKAIRVETALEGDRVALRVCDRGMGIARSDQEKIFKKFVRAGEAKTEGIKGTGLGLAMTQQIISAHGGQIRVESQPGAGSTFTILLPAMHEPAVEAARKQIAT